MEKALETFRKRFAPPGLKPGGSVAIPSLTGSADAFLALALAAEPRVVLAVVPGLPDADRLLADLGVICNSMPASRSKWRKARVLEFPVPGADDVTRTGTEAGLPAATPATTLRHAAIGMSFTGHVSVSSSFLYSDSPRRMYQSANGVVAPANSRCTVPDGSRTSVTSSSVGARQSFVQTVIGKPNCELSSLYRESGTPSRRMPTPNTV